MQSSNDSPNSLDYEKLGVAPPVHEEHGTEEEIANQLGVKQIHEWRQQGARLYCVACPFEHATEPRFIDSILQGTDSSGLPIMKKL